MLLTSLFRTIGHVVSSVLSLVRAQESTLAWGETDTEQWMLSVALWVIDTWQYIPVIHVLYKVVYRAVVFETEP